MNPRGEILWSKYSGRCGVCDKPYALGELIWFQEGEKVCHSECGLKRERSQKPVREIRTVTNTNDCEF